FAPADPSPPSLVGARDPRSAPAGAPVARLRAFTEACRWKKAKLLRVRRFLVIRTRRLPMLALLLLRGLLRRCRCAWLLCHGRRNRADDRRPLCGVLTGKRTGGGQHHDSRSHR